MYVLLIRMVYFMSNDTRRKVFEVADELLREGKRPTQQLIRDRIGVGSITTINKGLNEWWSALSDRFNNADASGTVPEAVIRQSARLWSEALSYARQEHKKLRSEQESILESINNQLLKERSEYAAKLQELSATIANQQRNLAGLENERQSLQKTLHATEEECYRLSKLENSRKNSSIASNADENLRDQLLEERVKLRIKQDAIDELSVKNQKLIEENAELRLKLRQVKS